MGSSSSKTEKDPRSFDETGFCESCWDMAKLQFNGAMPQDQRYRAIATLNNEDFDCQLCSFLLHMVLDARAINRKTIPKHWSTLPVPMARSLSELREFRVNPAALERREIIEQDPMFCWSPWAMVTVTLQSISEQEMILKQHGFEAAYNSRKWYDLNTVNFEWKDEYSVADGNYKTFYESRGPFRFRADPGQPAAKFVTNRSLSADFGSQTNFDQVKDWMSNCRTKHKFCRENKKGPLPTRVIHVGGANDLNVRLYTTNREAKNYLALSYCWGGEQDVRLEEATHEQMHRRIPFYTLPKTIQDAITITRKLGKKYLWIDSLCIIQDSEADKEKELGRMNEIYKAAYLTISASSAKGCNEGFLGARHLKKEIAFPYECPDGVLSRGFIQDVSHKIEREPIDSRAWTIQESMLSQRLLCYGSEQLCWFCRQRIEAWDSPVPPMPYGVTGLFMMEGKTKTEVFQRLESAATAMTGEADFGRGLDWTQIVEDYTARQLTYQTDKLLAISALALQWSILGKERGPYVAGLFLSKLPRHLMWFATAEVPRCSIPPYIAPTWSWASLSGQIQYAARKKEAEPSKDFFEVLECRTTPVSELVPLGSISGAVLKVRGRIRRVRDFTSREMDTPVIILMDENPDYRIQDPNCGDTWWLRVFTDDEKEELHRTEGLILKHLHANTYSRIGAFFEGEPGQALKRSEAFGADFHGSFMTGVFKDVEPCIISLE